MIPSTQDDRARLLEAVRRAVLAVAPERPGAIDAGTRLGAFLADSLTAVAFAARLEAELGAGEVPFEQWLLEHAERSDRLTAGSLVDWRLARLPAPG